MALFLLPFLFGCAFLNTLYNGWVPYKKALKTEEQMLREGADSSEILAKTAVDYQRAIDKATKTIDYYPKADRAHDDAYYLRGLACLKKQDYSCATHSFLLLQNNFPESKHYPESFFWVGRAYALK